MVMKDKQLASYPLKGEESEFYKYFEEKIA